ncbi:MAG: RIP metalloprotease RseP [Myxococcales bacterium]|nr:RIP metalloprotease RseP [Myxococcales bacterium]
MCRRRSDWRRPRRGAPVARHGAPARDRRPRRGGRGPGLLVAEDRSPVRGGDRRGADARGAEEVTLFWAILLIGVLVTVHELGHFVVAKLLDVKVLRLSLGFGPRLLKLRHGDTEYALSAIPLGGYVKMLGEDPNDEVAAAEQSRSFSQKPILQRLAIVLAGPAANLAFPALIYFQFFVSQETTLSSTIGAVFEGQPAAGVLQPGDRIIAIDDESVRYWEDVNRLCNAAPGRDLRITIERPGEDRPLVKVVTPRAHERLDLLGTRERVGLIGVAPHYRLAQIGVQQVGDTQSPAAKAGLRTFDVVTSVQGRSVGSWHDLDAALQHNRGEALVITYLRSRGGSLGFAPIDRLEPGTTQVFPERVASPAATPLPGAQQRPAGSGAVSGVGRARYETGIRSGDLFIHDLEAGSPAALAGIRTGDELTTLDGQPLRHWELLAQTFEEQPERTFRIGWRGATGEAREAEIKLQPRTRRDEYQTESTLYVFGAEPARAKRAVPEVAIDGRVGWAARRSLAMTVGVTATMVRVLALLLTGGLPATGIGGPIMLYHLAGVAAAHGTDQFLAMVALISLNLGLLNLLPVPVLDGGHVLFFTIEAIRGKPIAPRTRERAVYFGLALLAALMLLAARNDIVRYWFS